MTDSSLDGVIAQLHAAGIGQADARIAPFAAMLATLVPQLLSGQFAEQASKAIAFAKQVRLSAHSDDLINQIAEDVDRNGVDVQMELVPNSVKLNLKPNLVGFARGETPTLMIDTIELTETLSLDLGQVQHVSGQGTAVKVTITTTTTGSRNKNTTEYSIKTTSDVDLNITSRLG